ncbi:MAG: XTP/dITP diphosphatase [Dehalococcoidia bacterium]|nr:XTP/dITP diphosphatase [Dehalococcoidia bacterium]
MTSRPRLLIATHNKGKLRELTELLGDVPYELVSLGDLEIHHDVDETGVTFEQNAILKAETYCTLAGIKTLADDSGLEVDALGGEPGVRSARYAGPDATDAERVEFLLDKLDGIHPEAWSARFRCVIAIAEPNRPTSLYQGSCEGRIVSEPRGHNGFGYDPVFLFPGISLTMAELSTERKNSVSHRAEAAREAARSLRGQSSYT